MTKGRKGGSVVAAEVAEADRVAAKTDGWYTVTVFDEGRGSTAGAKCLRPRPALLFPWPALLFMSTCSALLFLLVHPVLALLRTRPVLVFLRTRPAPLLLFLRVRPTLVPLLFLRA